MTCYTQIFYIKNERIGRIEIFEFFNGRSLSRDNNNNEWKNKFTRERNHFGQDNSLFETYKQDNCPIFFCNTNIETFSWASFELVSNLKLSNSKLQSIEFLAKN